MQRNKKNCLENTKMNTLYEELKSYSDSDYYPFHMPGHKRRDMAESAKAMPDECTTATNGCKAIADGCQTVTDGSKALPYGIDITEIEGFDDLHHAHGILRAAQERAAGLYHADKTHFLVNGSTVGIISAICGTTKKGDTILVARNCHKSVYHAIYLNELCPVYLYPRFDTRTHLNAEFEAQAVLEALNEHPEIRAVVIVSPTYDGVVSDVAAIAEIAHAKGVPLIVDEAHGAHFGFHSAFPKNANMLGADVVIHSVHKTLPSLTQTALLHINGALVNRERIVRYLDMLQSSSPSYVLMAGIDSCMELLERRGGELFDAYVEKLMKLRRDLKELSHLKLVEAENYDISKVVISVENADITSRELYETLLSRYHLQIEMVAGTYVLAMTSIADTKEGFERLTNALLSIDNKVGSEKSEAAGETELVIGKQPKLPVIYTVSKAQDMPAVSRQSLAWSDAIGHISLEYAYLYPPGSPLIVPGECISDEAVRLLFWYEAHGFSVEGLGREGYIEVLKEENDVNGIEVLKEENDSNGIEALKEENDIEVLDQ